MSQDPNGFRSGGRVYADARRADQERAQRRIEAGPGNRVYEDARRAEEERAQRRLASMHSEPPPWADGPEPTDNRPPPDPAPQPEVIDHRAPDPAPDEAQVVELKPRRRRRRGKREPQQPEPQQPNVHSRVGVVGAPTPQTEPQRGINWIEWSSAATIIAGMVSISVCLGLWFNPYLGGIVAGVFLLIIGAALGVASTKNTNG